MPELTHERIYSRVPSRLRRILLQPFAEGCVQGRMPCLCYQTGLLNLTFVCTESDVLHIEYSVHYFNLVSENEAKEGRKPTSFLLSAFL